jgi:hypothetical protein
LGEPIEDSSFVADAVGERGSELARRVSLGEVSLELLVPAQALGMQVAVRRKHLADSFGLEAIGERQPEKQRDPQVVGFGVSGEPSPERGTTCGGQPVRLSVSRPCTAGLDQSTVRKVREFAIDLAARHGPKLTYQLLGIAHEVIAGSGAVTKQTEQRSGSGVHATAINHHSNSSLTVYYRRSIVD